MRVRPIAIAALLVSAVSQAKAEDAPLVLAQATTQTLAACTISCNTQFLQCAAPCANIIPGTRRLFTPETSALGTANGQIQCHSNCTSQQLYCNIGCAGLQ
jgi:hypothetical protein